jgi:Xaa-Pro aminopeptidase
MRLAVEVTARGFDDIVADLPIIDTPRGERAVEGIFHHRARVEGNGEGYDTIAASGPHACYLHWTRNDGAVVPGDLILIDAGVEVDSLYTADITRTLPVSGTFTDVQRRVYETVREAADAAFAVAKPGVKFRAVHEAAMAVIARRTAEWGLLPVTADEALDADAAASTAATWCTARAPPRDRRARLRAGAPRDVLRRLLEEGMVFTIEPGLYFQIDDLTVPEEYRGIGVRIEDDILVTADGPVNLSPASPHRRRGRGLDRAHCPLRSEERTQTRVRSHSATVGASAAPTSSGGRLDPSPRTSDRRRESIRSRRRRSWPPMLRNPRSAG